MLKFPRKEEEKKEKKWKEGGKRERKEGERRDILGRRGTFVKRNEGAWLATRKKNIFLGPALSIMKISLLTFGQNTLRYE